MRHGSFSEELKNTFDLALRESLELGNRGATVEHLMLGLLSVDRLVKELLVEYDIEELKSRIREEIEGIKGTKDYSGISEEVIDIVEGAYKEAGNWGSEEVNSEHLLFSILIRGKEIRDILNDSGIFIKDVARNYSYILSEEGVHMRETEVFTPMLDGLAVNLNEKAKKGEIDPVIGRADEIERVVEILSRRTKNNPVLIGDPGVGKTAIAEGLALNIVNGDVGKHLLKKRVMSLNVGNLMAGTKFRGELEDRVSDLVAELEEDKNVILFIDELHSLVGAGSNGEDDALDVSNMIKPALSRGELQCLGATTLEEYRKYIEKDVALTRRFQPVRVEEATVEESIEILKGLKGIYSSFHGVTIEDEIVEKAVKLSDRYIRDRFLPDKAIDVIDEAGSRVKLRDRGEPELLRSKRKEVEVVREEKEKEFANKNFKEAAKLREEEIMLQDEIDVLLVQLNNDESSLLVTEEDINHIVSKWSGVDVGEITKDEAMILVNLDNEIKKRIIGQDEAVDMVSRSIKRAKFGLKSEKRPIGSFLFVGSTGVGKTELARVLSETLFKDESKMIRLDMSEYMDKSSVSKLIGSAPGYIGYEEGGQLTEKVRRNPYSVVLLDEVEKAHPDVFNMLLQVLEDGRLTDSSGREVDFSNTLIIMTSNIGTGKKIEVKRTGFVVGDVREEEVDQLMDSVAEFFRPEFLNRLDSVVKFNKLGKGDLKKVLGILVDEFKDSMLEKDLEVEMTGAVSELLLKDGIELDFGARPLKRSIQRNLEDFVSDEYLKGNIRKGDKVSLGVKEGKMEVREVAGKVI